MQIRNITVSFLIMLFCFQQSPFLQAGSILYRNQILEKIPNGQDSGQQNFSEESFKQFESAHILTLHKEVSLDTFLLGMPTDASVVTRSSDDIQTPPPNQIA